MSLSSYESLTSRANIKPHAALLNCITNTQHEGTTTNLLPHPVSTVTIAEKSSSQDKDNDVGFIVLSQLGEKIHASVATSMESLSQDKEDDVGFIVLS
jgi:hypothetical protein